MSEPLRERSFGNATQAGRSLPAFRVLTCEEAA